ncbi:MAG: YraN family protein [Paracoccaceae bacterium]
MNRQMRGQNAHLAGLCAEQCVADDYARRGYALRERRWRGPGGEIDLVLDDGEGLVFVEVKKSKSFARAVERITARQIARISASATAYLADMPRGLLTDIRFDVALVDGTGALEIMENAFA